jgi:phosphoserine phosphatase RsbU/P
MRDARILPGAIAADSGIASAERDGGAGRDRERSRLTTHAPPGGPSAKWLLARAKLDAVGVLASIIAAYSGFIGFIGRQGIRQVRLATEMQLAREIHDSLAPPIAMRAQRFEAYGRSLPSSEVGGDLADLMRLETGVIALVADVSGHGVGAGILMAMVRATARARIAAPGGLREGGLGEVLAAVNDALIELDRKERFVTMAALWLPDDGVAEVALGGHLPILRVREGRCDRLENRHLPLGVYASERYLSRTLDALPGDLFVLLTDGAVEVEDRAGRELGLNAIEQTIIVRAGAPLESIFEAVMEQVRGHGRQVDDVTVLLARKQ